MSRSAFLSLVAAFATGLCSLPCLVAQQEGEVKPPAQVKPAALAKADSTAAGAEFVAGLPELLAALAKARKVGTEESGVLPICERMAVKFGALSDGDLRVCPEEVAKYSQVLHDLRDPAGCRAVVERLGKALAGSPGQSEEKRQILAFWIARTWMAERNYTAAVPLLEAADECLSRTRKPGDALRLNVRKQYCEALYRARRPREALALHNEVLEILRGQRSSRPGPSVEAERFLGVLSHHSGDRQGAFVAFEAFLAGMLEQFPDDVARVQMARQNLASAMMALHDYWGALELMRKVVEVDKKRYPRTDLHLIDFQMTIVQIVQQLHDTEEAVALLDEVWPHLQANPESALRERLIADWHRFRGQASMWEDDFEAACEHILKAQELIVKTRGTDHWQASECLLYLGSIQRRTGEVERSLETVETAFARLRKTHRIENHFVQIAIGEIITSCRMLGRFDRAIELVSLLHDAVRQALSRNVQASRAMGALARRQGIGLGRAVDLMREEISPQQRASLARIAMSISQLRLGMETRVARETSRIRSGRRDEVQSADRELLQVANQIQTVANRAASAKRAESLAGLVRERERLERKLVELSRASQLTELPSLKDLAEALPKQAVAAALVQVACQHDDLERVEDRGDVQWFVGLVLDSDGAVEFVDLGPAKAIADLAGAADKKQRLALRRKVLDPVLAIAQKRGADKVILAVDRLLQLVPLAALPLDSGEPVGSKVRLQRVSSLLDLLVSTPVLPADPKLVAVGGVDYDVKSPGIALPLVAAAAPELRSHGEGGQFASLPATAGEVDALSAAFRKAFPQGAVVPLIGSEATKRSLLRKVPGASVVHLATHGFCAPGAEKGAKPVSRSALDPTTNVEALTAYAHCGLAMTGANLPPNEDGSLPGVLTGEELKQFDLVDAYLVVLSACDSARGLRSSTSHASLHCALHGAGARFIVSSLWKVGDRAARQIMTDFYEGLWQRPEDPHGALWSAKLKARRAGVAFRDWAGFFMTGI